MNVSINFELPVWLCNYTVIVVYIFVFSLTLSVAVFWAYRWYDVCITRRGISNRWKFYLMSRHRGHFDRCYMVPAMSEWMASDKDGYYGAIVSSLGENDMDFLAWAKYRYGEGYDEAIADAEKQLAAGKGRRGRRSKRSNH